MRNEDWRVEVELDVDLFGHSLSERLRALDLDEEAKRRLGRQVLITRDESRLFLYTETGSEAAAAARVLQEIVDADGLAADISVRRWNASDEEWQDPSVAPPRTEAEQAQERDRRDDLERREAQAEGAYDWYVHVKLPSMAGAVALEQQLRGRSLDIERRWRYLTIAAATEQRAEELVALIHEEAADAEAVVQPHLDLPSPFFVLVRSWL